MAHFSLLGNGIVYDSPLNKHCLEQIDISKVIHSQHYLVSNPTVLTSYSHILHLRDAQALFC
jgi:hypothetical protein